MRRQAWIICLIFVGLCLTSPADVSAQVQARVEQPVETATVKGRIFDEETGESMPYTNVFVAGTNIGTMAFTDGFYIIRGLAAGTYTIKASYISYAMGSQTVTLAPGEVIDLDFSLEVQAIMADPLEIAAERALVEIDRTGSSHYISSKEIEAMPLDQVIDMIAMQPGVTIQDNEIHIRGGRADDTQFVIDGMSVNDPLAGGGYGYDIDESIINEIEVLTGGFNAEYGQAVSGVVNITTKEGGDRLEGKVSYKTDHLMNPIPKNDFRSWTDFTEFTESNNVDTIKASMSGPDPLSAGLKSLGLGLPGKQYVMASASLDTRDGYLPIYSRQERLESPIYKDDFWAPRQQNDWNGLLKWTWHITPSHKLNINASRQVGISQGFRLPGEGYPRNFMDNLDNYLTFTTENILTQVYYRQVLSDTEWFEVTLGRNFNRMHANVNGNDDFAASLEDTSSGSGTPDSQDDFDADRWHDHYSESWTLKGSYSFMGVGNNKFKTGMDLSFTEMQLIDLQDNLFDPPGGKLAQSQDIFAAHPITGSAYFQDTAEYRGLIINAGLRGDFWAPGREVEHVMANHEDYLFIYPEMVDEFQDKTFGALGRRWKMRLSPRLGLSFPVTERDKFFFNYGHFSQWPRFAYVYPQLQTQVASQTQLLGNPNLDPKITVEYETGIQHEFTGLWSLGVTFFNRDIFGYAKSVGLDQVVITPEDTPDPYDEDDIPIDPVRYFNGDSARSLGVEISVVKRTTKWLSGSASFEMQRSTGTNSDADAAYLSAKYGSGYDRPSIGGLTRKPLVWDKPWSMSLNLDFSVFDKDRPDLFGWLMPPNWSVNVLARAEAGQRYTPLYYEGPQNYIDGDDYSQTGPWKSTVNIRLNKFWKIGKKERLTCYLEVRNLFNHLNYRRINRFTGEGYQLGDFNPSWLEDYYGEPVDSDDPHSPIITDTNNEAYAKSVVNPSYLENPFMLMWGVSYSW